MTIRYFGHSCFRVEAVPEGAGIKEKFALIFDPFDKETGLKPPAGKVDLVCISHNHHDHSFIGDLREGFFLVKNPGEYSYKGVSIKGISTFHDQKEGEERGLNTIFVVDIEGIRICHLGDLGHVLKKEQIEKIGDVHILMVPVGGNYTINAKEAVEVVKAIEPAIILPMHFGRPELKIDGLSEVGDFYKEFGMDPKEKLNELKIKLQQIDLEETKVVELVI